MNAKRLCRTFLLMAVALIVANCSETQFLANAVKEGAGTGGSYGASYKVGRPYQIKGVWYRPHVDYAYNETGIASWYGPQFHGKTTANGEVFDMNTVSAAHKTLPLPSMVRVTNLKNGRAMNIRINDRGPFAHGRIIDLSKRAAQLLGFERAGTAPVRVQVLERESRILAAIAKGQAVAGGPPAPKPRAAPSVAVASKPLPPPPPTRVAEASEPQQDVLPMAKEAPQRPLPPEPKATGEVVKVAVPPNSQIFIQAGAFSKYENANRVHTLLQTVGRSKITLTTQKEQKLFRVRLGPFDDVKLADTALERVISSGYPEARIVVD
jgi:rare lipoprotein A